MSLFHIEFSKKNAPLERSILPLNDVVLFFKIELEMTSRHLFEVGRLIESAIDSRKSVPARFGGHFLLLH